MLLNDTRMGRVTYGELLLGVVLEGVELVQLLLGLGKRLLRRLEVGEERVLLLEQLRRARNFMIFECPFFGSCIEI